MSALTESGSGDHFINDSQIIVGDATNASGGTISTSFGLIGVGIATAIDKTNNYNVIKKSSLYSPIKFDAMINQKLQKAITSDELSAKLGGKNPSADIKIVPYARMSFKDKPLVKTSYGMFVRFKNSADNKEVKKSYVYTPKEPFALTDLEANGNALFIENADKAFTALAKVFVLDSQNKIDYASSNLNQDSCLNSTSGEVVYVNTPQDICLNVAYLKNKPIVNSLLITEK